MNPIKIARDRNLFLVPIETPTVSSKQVTANNHIWIFDRSGSMSGAIRELVDTIARKVHTLIPGDTLSIGWFSGPGQYDFILKGFEIQADSEDKVAAIISKYASTVGSTCFSQIIAKTDTVINDLKTLNSDFSLVFFTDGYPCVPDYQKEIAAINKAIELVEGKLTSALIVGFGNYYNRDLLVDMAERFGGTFVHSSNLGQYDESMTEFVSNVSQYGRKVKVDVGQKRLAVFAVSGSTIVAYRPDAVGIIHYAPPLNGGQLYAVTEAAFQEGKYDELVANKPRDYRAAAAAALVLSMKTKVAHALEILGNLGDVALVDAINNAFTNEEYGKAEAKIRAAIKSPAGRFVGGSDRNYLPKADAFCVVDAINLIAADPEAVVLIGSDYFDYNRIGQKAVQKEGTPVFVKDLTAEVPANNLVWNSSKLNLGIQCKIPGKVKLDKDAEKFGFAATYPTYIFRNYTIVKDGNVNMPAIPMKLSLATIKKLTAEGAVTSGHSSSGCSTWVLVALGNLPVMNRAMAGSNLKAKELCQLLVKELDLEAEAKVLRTYVNSFEKTVPIGSVLTAAQSAYLEKFYIGKNGFAAPRETAEATDSYDAIEFNVKIKSFSGLPSLKDLEAKTAKVEAGKGDYTPSEKLILETVEMIGPKAKVDKALAEAKFKSNQSVLRQLRSNIQSFKFAVLLGKQWFSEFQSRDDREIDVERLGKQYHFTFEVRSVPVPF